MDPSRPPSPGEITGLIAAAAAGDREALDRAVPLLYTELRRIAGRQLRREGGVPTLHATDLVHEAWFKLAGHPPPAADRAHFLALAARAMRQVLVDRARRRLAAKRGAGAEMVTFGSGEGALAVDPAELLALDQALDGLEARQRQVVEYRFFGGLEEKEIGELLGVTERTVRRDWLKARAWLYRALYPEAP
jgi:RNA polymerase sigma factor (TIGR02999 family)